MMHLTETFPASDKMSSGFCCVGYQYFSAGTAQLPTVRGERKKKTLFSNSKYTQIIHITTRCGGSAAKRVRVPVNRLPETSPRVRQP